MTEPLDRTVDHDALDALDAGMAAAFGPDSGRPLLAAGSSALRALSAAFPGVTRVSLHDPDSGSRGLIVRPNSPEMPEGRDPADRLQLHGEIARGGMGAILRGRDMDLGREIAVKVLLESNAGRAELVQRFVEEAQIAAQLQHPSIVPVYEFGQFRDGRPYFTMKLLQGQTLAKLLAQRVSPVASAPGVDRANSQRLPPGDEAAGPARLVQIFEQVCQAVGYAHAHGVIHRDLKPSNVVVGSFGEVQVIDWGLAKVLKDGGIADEKARQQAEDLTTIRTRRSEGSDAGGTGSDTQAGSVMGTPAYMPPEQALGEVDRLDERADVFGLGAILCEVLTGKPPYVGDSTDQLHRMAARGDLADAFARLDGCGAGAELVGLCKRCLAADPAGRPADAKAVAEAVGAYQRGVAERLRGAELGRAAAEATAVEERKRRKVQLGLAAALVGLVVTGAGGGLLVQHQAAKQGRERAQRDQEQHDAVGNALALAESLQRQARWPEARVLLDQALARLDPAGHEDLRRRLRGALDDLDVIDRLDDIRLRKATWVRDRFDHPGADRAYAEVLAGLGVTTEKQPAAAVDRLADSPIKAQLVEALDDWADATSHRPRREWLFEVARRLDPHPLRDRLRDPKALADPRALAQLDAPALAKDLSPQLAVALAGRLPAGRAVALLEAVQRQHPEDFWVCFILGNLLHRQRRDAEAVGHYRAAVSLRPSAVAARNNLATALNRLGRPEEAVECYRRALEIDPTFANAHNNLGVTHHEQGRLDEAIACYLRALEINPTWGTTHYNLGLSCQAKGKTDEAISYFRKAIDLEPGASDYHLELGSVLKDKGRAEEAMECFRKAIDLAPASAKAHYGFGVALGGMGKVDEAMVSYRKAVELDRDHGKAHNNLGILLREKKKLDEAIACFRRALEIDPKDTKARFNLGVGLRDKGRVDEAIACFRRALELDPKYPDAHHNLALALRGKGEVDEAIANYRAALELTPDDAKIHANLGVALHYQRKLTAAIACYRKAVEIDPGFANARFNLAQALQDAGQLDEAITHFRRAIELDPKLPSAHYLLGNAYQAKGRPDEAVACFRAEVQANPKNAQAHNNLGLALYNQGKAGEAVGCFREALKLAPNLPQGHSNLGMALYNQGKVDEAVACYRKALELNPKLVGANAGLGQCLLALGRYGEAEASTRRAFELARSGSSQRQILTRQLETCRRLLDLEARLPAVLRGEARLADARERLMLAEMCARHKGLHAAAARFYAEAFAEQPGLADILRARHRYNGACSAALASAGKGEGGGGLSQGERARWRRQALTWLRADLLAWGRLLQRSPAIAAQLVPTLQHWQKDADLAGLRDPAVIKLLSTEERQACERLWADVAALLAKTGGGRTQPKQYDR